MKYRILIFDLDNTLIDFSYMEEMSLGANLKKHGLPHEEEHIKAYKIFNSICWDKLERGIYDKDTCVVKRFEMFLKAYELSGDARQINEDYLNSLPNYARWIDGAKELIEELYRDYYLIMMTNGVKRAQEQKIKNLGLDKYFKHIIISDDTGFSKPDIRIFEYMENLSGQKNKCEMLMIGDSLSSDILGGINYKIDTCWYNPKGKKSDLPFTYSIEYLGELRQILKEHQ